MPLARRICSSRTLHGQGYRLSDFAMGFGSKLCCERCGHAKPIDSFRSEDGKLDRRCDGCRGPVAINARHKSTRDRLNRRTKQAAQDVCKKLAGRNYKERDAILKAMGFKSYSAYLRSQLWARIRRHAFGVLGSNCAVCDEKAEVIHHTRYSLSDLKGQTIDFMVQLCNDCHESIERHVDGKKTSLKAANKKLYELCAPIQ